MDTRGGIKFELLHIYGLPANHLRCDLSQLEYVYLFQIYDIFYHVGEKLVVALTTLLLKVKNQQRFLPDFWF
jgi:hypothetical protein